MANDNKSFEPSGKGLRVDLKRLREKQNASTGVCTHYVQGCPIGRLLRGTRLAPICTASNEIMKLLIQHEIYKMMRLLPKDIEVEVEAMDCYKEVEEVYECKSLVLFFLR